MDTWYFMGDSIKDLLTKAQPFIAVGIFIFLIVMGILLFREQNLKQEISENCGWGEDDYYCYCEKGAALEIKNKMESGGQRGLDVDLGGLEDASLAG